MHGNHSYGSPSTQIKCAFDTVPKSSDFLLFMDSATIFSLCSNLGFSKLNRSIDGTKHMPNLNQLELTGNRDNNKRCSGAAEGRE
jgi:hypothetical protein